MTFRTPTEIEEAIALQRAGRLDAAAAAYASILARHPEDADAMHLLGTLRLAQGDFERAEALVRNAIAQSDSGIYHATLSTLLREKGDAEGAILAAERAVELLNRGEVHHTLGLAYEAAGRHPHAIAAFRAALKLDPWLVLAHVSLGHALFRSRELAEALAEYMLAIFADESCVDARCGVGMILADRGELEAAIETFELALRANPQHVESHVNLAHALARSKRTGEAKKHVEEALRLRPRYAPAQNALGSILLLEGKHRLALEAFERASGDDPSASQRNAAAALLMRGKIAEGRALLEEEVARHPTRAQPMASLAQALLYEGRPKEAVEWAKKAIAIDPMDLAPRSFVLGVEQAASDVNPDDLFELASEWGRVAIARNPRLPPAAVDRTADRKLRIGFVSGDFRTHPIGFFLGAIVPELDARELDVHCYSNNAREDEHTATFKRNATWRKIDTLGDGAVAELVRADRIDILVDLSGHTYLNRLQVFARKPAPIQATWLGYYATTGVGAIDWIMADEIVLPQSEQHRFIERPLRLPGCYVCGFNPSLPIGVNPLPSMRSQRITFGNFNNLTKLSDATIAVWARILDGVPGSRLLLKTHFLGSTVGRQQTLERFAKHGVGADRLMLDVYAPRAELLRTYHNVDIALDPFPFNGGTTTVEALWMGVPVLGKRGAMFVGHVGETLLRAGGVPELCAEDDVDYVRKAVELAGDRDRLSSLRASLRERYLRSSLCDARRFAQQVGDAFRSMWTTWLDESS